MTATQPPAQDVSDAALAAAFRKLSVLGWSDYAEDFIDEVNDKARELQQAQAAYPHEAQRPTDSATKANVGELASALSSFIEYREGIAIRFDKSGGCAPATLFEKELWAALASEARQAQVVGKWRWVDEKGRAMTNWEQGEPPPPPPMAAVSDDKGTMRVEYRVTSPQSSAPVVGTHNPAELWRWVERAFDASKISASEQILDALGLPTDNAVMPLSWHIHRSESALTGRSSNG